MPSAVDLAVLALLTLAVPWIARWGHRRLERRVAAGAQRARVTGYRGTMIWQWALTAALLFGWTAAGRPLEELGLRLGDRPGLWWGLAVTLVLAGFLWFQSRQVTRSQAARAAARQQLARFETVLPHDRRELSAFYRLSLTAGICEEIVYRGYLMWLLDALSGPAVAVAGSAVVFALGHAYQGRQGMARTGVVGLVQGGIYLLTGAVWVPMLLHAATDLTSGRMAHAALSDHPGPPPGASDGD